jgi:hypothetical protein
LPSWQLAAVLRCRADIYWLRDDDSRLEPSTGINISLRRLLDAVLRD